MAAVLKVDPSFVAPPGMEQIDTGYASEDIEVGDPVVIVDTPVPNKMWTAVIAKATGTELHGFCVKTTKTRGMCEYASQGEIDGFTGMTPGNSLTIVDGVLDDTEAEGLAQIRAVNPNRIRFNLV